MNRVYNFSAGPSMLPLGVLEEAQKDLIDYQGCGMSVMEMSHRSAHFQKIIDTAERDLREVMGIPDNYKVLFLQGGASQQFAMVPMNLMINHKKADYVNSGSFASKAIEEAAKYGEVRVLASSKDKNYNYIPHFNKDDISRNADYVHITYNNTIFGTHYQRIPDTGSVPLVTDMSSSILSEPIDVSRFGLIYAGAQKNIAPAGLTLVIVREDLICDCADYVPTMLSYKTHSESGSMYNTPPCFCIYIAGLVFKHLKSSGGVEAIAKVNKKKAAILYDFLDSSSFFKAKVSGESRSLMNVTFACTSSALDEQFVKQAVTQGFFNLKGHRSVGGMRASIYNAMPAEGIKKLVDFMHEFEKKNL